MEPISLLHPPHAKAFCQQLTDEAINDLSLDYLCNILTEDIYEQNVIKKTLTSVTCDEETIRYRCGVFEDFLRFPELRKNLTDLLAELADLRDLERFQKDGEASSLWVLINRLREIDGYVKCITEMKNCLEALDIRSEGLLYLKKMVQNIYASGGFPQLKQDIDETFAKARKLRSITIGVNLDDLLRPKNAGVLSLNDTEFSSGGLMKNFLKFASGKEELHHGTDIKNLKHYHPSSPKFKGFALGTVQQNSVDRMVHIEASEITGADPLSDSLKKSVTSILKRTVGEIKRVLQKYVNISGYAFTALMPELIFYIRFAELVDKIQSKGLPMCRPEILPCSQRCFFAKEIYNLKLAVKAVQGEAVQIVTNAFSFDEKGRIFILTGPNRGGKTTFTQAVGLCFLLAQNGIYVPCARCGISPCDNIYTHFPADENDTVDLGRLGEESKRLSEIFKTATDKSLLLLNESLATTNVAEGLYIARDVVKSMRYLGVRAIFNTHMHDLARNLEALNAETPGDSKIVSLVTGIEHGERSFKIALAPPQGSSYAKDIAKKYGVTFEQIKKQIENKSIPTNTDPLSDKNGETKRSSSAQE